MMIYYNAQDRKPLVKAISEFTGADAVYLRTPTYAYRIDYFTVTREGNIEFDDRADSEEIEELLEFLYKAVVDDEFIKQGDGVLKPDELTCLQAAEPKHSVYKLVQLNQVVVL